MRRLFAALDVDFVQWRALSRAYLLGDFAAFFGAYGPAESRRAARELILQFIVLTLAGLAPAVSIWLARDTYFAATVMISMTCFLVGMTSLVKTASIVGPDDYEIVGYRPVSSRTYFAVRATGIFFDTLVVATVTGYLPVVAFLLRPNGSLKTALAAIVAIAAAALTVTCGALTFYGWLVRVVPPARLRIATTIAQTVFALLPSAVCVLALVQFADAVVPSDPLLGPAPILAHSAWPLLYPVVWFASYVEIANGTAGRFEIIGAVLSLLLLAVCALPLRGVLSAGYASRVAEPMESPQRVPAAATRWSFLGPEHRAITILIVNSLRADLNFQLNVVMMIGMLVFTLVFDGFGDRPTGQTSGLGIAGRESALFFGPLYLLQTLRISPAFEASWIFFTTPADRTRLVMASRDLVAVFFLLPALVVAAAFFVHDSAHPGSTLLATAFIGALGYVTLQFAVALKPLLPFAAPAARGFSPGAFLIIMPAMIVLDRLVQWVLYTVPGGTVIATIGIGSLVVLLNRLTRRRVETGGQKVVYFG